MFFDSKEKILRVDAGTLVRLASLGAVSVPDGEEESVCFADEKNTRLLFPGAAPLPLKATFPLYEGMTCEVSATAYRVPEENAICLCFVSENDPRHLPAHASRLCRGMVYAAAHLFSPDTAVSVKWKIYSPVYADVTENEERVSHADAAAFFAKLLSALAADATHEVDRVTRRLPSMAAAAFPYAEVREGQKDLMSAVYGAAKRGGTLFACAPTGTGKTMAVLFPAVRVLGNRYAEKIFYFTPKTTSANAARDAISLLRERGVLLRGVLLTAKERICDGRRERGSCNGCPCKNNAAEEGKAAEELLALDTPVVTEKELLAAAARHGVCPYELSLRYSRYADVVIGDYNYLFDPRAYLRRYFSQSGKYIFLIDEAHNLPDRAREMYSGTLDRDALSALAALFADSAPAREQIAALSGAFEKTAAELLQGEMREDENGQPVGFAATAVFPEKLVAALGKTVDALLPAVRRLRPGEDAQAEEKRSAVFALRDLYDKAAYYDERFRTYALCEGDKLSVRLFCVDPSAQIAMRVDKGISAVFFSATLSPMEYYRSVLYGNRPAAEIEAPSPFSPDALCVGVLDKISVRAVAREETMPELARVIGTVMREREGNYMVFCPSFAYMEKLAAAFHTLAPRAAIAVQGRHMSVKERAEFLARFAPRTHGHFVGFCVTGGIYAEGIDLCGDRLIGAIVVGVGLPQVSAERELIGAYYQDKYEEGKEYAYLYPGMNRILQAAGRVIRRESDRGVIVLVDDRFRDPACYRIFPALWHDLRYAGDRKSLSELLRRFWRRVDEEQATPPDDQSNE